MRGRSGTLKRSKLKEDLLDGEGVVSIGFVLVGILKISISYRVRQDEVDSRCE